MMERGVKSSATSWVVEEWISIHRRQSHRTSESFHRYTDTHPSREKITFVMFIGDR